MKVLFLCGVFATENEKEIISHANRAVEYSANRFQEKLICGFLEQGYDCSVLSAPFIGAYPVGSNIMFFKGFQEHQDKYEYVNFCNIWGFRNASRAASLKVGMKSFIEADDAEKLIVVYSPHTPFLQAAVYAKKKDPRIKITIVVPDLPQYMNLNSKISIVYKLGKKYDIAKFEKLLVEVDSFVVLTEPMKDVLKVGDRSYIVVEGIVETDIFETNKQKKALLKKEEGIKYIVYTGKMNEKFGTKLLVDAFRLLDGSDLRLVLCGRGDMDTYIHEQCTKDSRIIALGQVTPNVAQEWVLKADVLVNPRPNNEEYTKYSFPSKNVEYLASGNPVVAYMLDGMTERYRDYINEVPAGGETELKNTIEAVLQRGNAQDAEPTFFEYARNNLSCSKVADRIVELYKTCKGNCFYDN